MPKLPKPEPRPKKPRRPIPRVRAKGKRKKVTAAVARTKLKKACNDLWAYLVKARDGWVCRDPRPHEHTAIMQAAHGFGKKVYPSTRYELWNGMCLCSSSHSFYTYREAPWYELLRSMWGQETYRVRLSMAQGIRKSDLAEVYASLRQYAIDNGLDAEARERGLL